MKEVESLECAICFESIADSTVLPCSCKIDYCAQCWNKALAGSFNQCGHARCPSCRTPVHVSYDSDANRLVFARETQCFKDGPNLEYIEETVERIAREAMPAQIRILQEFGTANSLLSDLKNNPKDAACKMSPSQLKAHIVRNGGDPSGCLEKTDLVDCLLKAVEQEAFVSMVVAEKLPPPKCVCGSALVWLDGRSRLRKQFPEERITDSDFENLYNTLIRDNNGDSGTLCDVCDGKINLSASVWTCENGSGTILHATSYDICESCLVRHSCESLQVRSDKSLHSCESPQIEFSKSFEGEV